MMNGIHKCTLFKILRKTTSFAIYHNASAVIVQLMERVSCIRENNVCPVFGFGKPIKDDAC